MRQLILVQPHRALGRLAHLGAIGPRDQRGRQAKGILRIHPADEIGAVDDIAPLVTAAHLQRAAKPPVQFQIIIGLENHVVELDEAQRLLPLQPQPHAVKRQHPVDREMPAIIAQERHQLQPRQPIIIVDHHRIGRPIAKAQEPLENPLDAGQIGIDLLIPQQLPRLILARRITNLGRPAAHQHDRLVPRLLQMPQHHDRNQIADVQAERRAIKADIGRDRALARRAIQRRRIGDLMNKPARFETGEKVAAVRHGEDGFTVCGGACHALACAARFDSFSASGRFSAAVAHLPRHCTRAGC